MLNKALVNWTQMFLSCLFYSTQFREESTKNKKPVEETAKKKDIVEIINADIVNDTKTDTVVETKPDASPKSKSLIIKLDDLVPFKDHPFAYASRRKPWESLWGSSATTPLVDFHRQVIAHAERT